MIRTNRVFVPVALTCAWLITMVSCHSSEASYAYSTSTSNYVIVTSKLTWSNAKDTCAATGSHLVYVNSADESQTLSDAISGFGASTSDYWMGLEGNGDDTWVWLDGIGPRYTNWPASGKREDDDCITLHVSSQTWKAHNCDSNKKYICEEDEIITTTLPTTINVETTESVCPDGFQLFETSCYRAFSEVRINGLDARTVCVLSSPGSHLVFIESQSEQTFLKAFVEVTGVETDFWIGLTTTSDGDHEWLDGAPLGFSAWDPTGHHNMLACIRLRRNAEFLWNDRPCSVEYGYICEMEMTASATILATEVITETPAIDVTQTVQPTTAEQHLEYEQTTTPFRTVTAEENLFLTELITETPAEDEIPTMQPTTADQYIEDEQTTAPFRTVTAEENLVLTELITEKLAIDVTQTVQPTTAEQHLEDEQTTTPFRTVTVEENLTTEAPITVLITEDITETPAEGGDFQTVQLSTVLHHLEDDLTTTPSRTIVTEERFSTVDHFTTPQGAGTPASTPSPSTCQRREKNVYLHTAGKTFPGHVVFKTIKGSVLKCAAACIREACAWFVFTRSNDCLLSKEASGIDQLLSDDSASLYHVGG